MTADRETLAAYAAKLEDYARMADDLSGDPRLGAFIAALPKGARVLDLGCGPGWAARRMAMAGLVVEATDASPAMVGEAADIPGVTARVASFDDLDGTDIYDGIWANFSLLHAPRADMPRHLAALRRALKPGGLFHIGMKTGTGAHRDSLGRFYTYYTEEELHVILRDAGFVPFSSDHGCDTGLAGTPEDWVTIAAHG
ncbi:methyltransferase domain-containing protein [Roseovarius salis]|uniref:class I SAM-dependent methyltransferase n=1 Tax=Roseovarius salis TaxID=3376063 RepID=UPI0037C97F8F